MNADELLSRTFGEHDHPTPDPDAVLAEVHARIGRRRRTVPVLVTAAAVVALAVGTVAVVGHERRPPLPAAAPSLTETMIDTTYLPPGSVRTTVAENFFGQQIRAYTVTGTDQVPTTIQLAVLPRTGSSPLGSTEPAALGYQRRELTIGGRAAQEWRNDTGRQDSSYEIAVELPGDQVAQVRVSVPRSRQGRGGALATLGERVAGSLVLDRPEPVETDFRPTYVPAGLEVRGAGRADTFGTTWILGRPDSTPSDPAVTIQQNRSPFSFATVPSATEGRPVQGHPTHVYTDTNGLHLRIDGLGPDVAVTVTATGGLVPPTELYKIADGIR